MLTVHVNGDEREAPRVDRSLLSFLRFDLGLTGTKYGCGEGLCGACTVLVDGQPLRSCMTTVGAVAGGDITTIEGLSSGETFEQLHPVQQAFVDQQAMQCGYCIPGFVMGTVGLLNRESCPRADRCARRSRSTCAAAARTSGSSRPCCRPPRRCERVLRRVAREVARDPQHRG